MLNHLENKGRKSRKVLKNHKNIDNVISQLVCYNTERKEDIYVIK